MKPRQSLRLNKAQERAYIKRHAILSAGPRKSRWERLWQLLGVR